VNYVILFSNCVTVLGSGGFNFVCREINPAPKTADDDM
jgi:hypothetical protein